jgi:hypothetical protein
VADHRHKRDANARRLSPFRARAVAIAGPLAFLATASAVTLGVLGATPAAPEALSAETAPGAGEAPRAAAPLPPRGGRGEAVSRGGPRADATETAKPAEDRKPSQLELLLSEGQTKKAIKSADERLWTQAPLNIWTKPGDEGKQVGVIDAGRKLLVTGRALFGREEVVVEGESRWVTTGYLSTEEPSTLGGDCTNGTSVPSGVSENIVKVHEAVCAEFPEITTYGTFRDDGEHSQGLAVDIMVSGDRGWQVAEFVRKYYAELGVNYVIYSQNIWSVERSGEGWRPMEDRGSTTANHYDHVHVTTY